MIRIGVLTALFTALWVSTANASAREGAIVAQDICTTCHLVHPGQTPEPVWRDSLPTFQQMADRHDLTKERLINFLTKKHASSTNPSGMPKVGLTQRQIKDVSTYIVSLRHR